MQMRAKILELLLAYLIASMEGCAGGGFFGGERRIDEARVEVDRKIEAAIASGNFAEALELADSLLSGGAESSRIISQRARALGGLGRNEEALEAFEEAIVSDYENCENHIEFAVFLMKTGKSGRALTEFEEAKKFCDRAMYPLIDRNLAVASLERGESQKALRYIEDALKEAPFEPYLCGFKAMLIAAERPDEAEKLFEMALSGGERNKQFLVSYGILLMNAGKDSQAVRVLSEASSIDPEDLELRIHLAQALEKVGRSHESERLLRELVEKHGNDSARWALAGAKFRESRYEEALNLYLGLQETPETMDRIAMCLHNLGRSEEALAWALRANREKSDWPTGMINLAVILAAKGDLDKARELLERVIEIDPENEVARSNLDRLIEAGRVKH